jgi:hypothetical protein
VVDAGVRDQVIDTVADARGRLHQSFEVELVADVRTHGVGLAAALLDPRRDRLDRVGVAGTADDRRPLVGERACDRPTDPPCSLP